MTFQTTVLYIAIVILILSLIFIAISLYNGAGASKFPPVSSTCPDYFKVTGDGKCTNTFGLGKISDPGCAVKGGEYTPEDKACDKYKTAVKCHWTWNGITNTSDDLCASAI